MWKLRSNFRGLRKRNAKSRLEEIEKIINNDINGFDEDTFTNLVDEVIIRKRYELEFKFKCGISKKWLAEWHCYPLFDVLLGF